MPSRESRRRQTLNLPWPIFVRGWSSGSAWPGSLRFGRCGYSEHRMLLVAGLPLYCTVPRQLRKYAQLTRAMHPNTLFVRPVFNRSRPDGSSALACRVVPRRLSYSDVGTRFNVADSIRNLGQEDRAVVMPHWNTRQTTSRNGCCTNRKGHCGREGRGDTLLNLTPEEASRICSGGVLPDAGSSHLRVPHLRTEAAGLPGVSAPAGAGLRHFWLDGRLG